MSEAPLPRAYWKQWSASAISNMGDGMNVAAMPLLALALTDDARLIAAVSMVSFLPWLLLSLPAGVIIDRYDRRTLMVTVNLTRGLLFAVIALGAASGWMSIWILLAVLAAVGVCEVLFDNAAQAFLPAIVPSPLLPKANGRLFAAEVVTNTFLGLPVGAWLFVVAAGLPFGINSATFILAALLVASIRVPPQTIASRQDGSVRSFHEDLVEGLRWLWRHRFLRNLAILLGFTNLGGQVGLAIFVKFATEEMGVGPSGFGLLLAVMSVGAIVGGLVGDRLASFLGTSTTLVAAYLVFGVGELIIGGVPVVWVVATVAVVQGLATTTWNVVTVSLRQQLIPTEMFGRVNSVYRWVGWGTIPIGALIGGFVAHGVNLRAPFLVGGTITLLGLALFGRTLLPAQVNQAKAEATARQAGEG